MLRPLLGQFFFISYIKLPKIKQKLNMNNKQQEQQQKLTHLCVCKGENEKLIYNIEGTLKF